jgi:hypothetical protein
LALFILWEVCVAKKNFIDTTAAKVFDNLIFIAEVFADREAEEIPDVPLLELARSFDLRHFGVTPKATAERECVIELRKQAVG